MTIKGKIQLYSSILVEKKEMTNTLTLQQKYLVFVILELERTASVCSGNGIRLSRVGSSNKEGWGKLMYLVSSTKYEQHPSPGIMVAS